MPIYVEHTGNLAQQNCMHETNSQNILWYLQIFHRGIQH